MRKTFINLLSVIITAIWLPPVMMAQVVKHKELPRFHQINEKLYRGAQPRRGGLMRLKQLGVKTVVNLRGSNEDIRSEEQYARALGFNYFSVPIDRIGRPADAKVQRVLAIINAAENQPVFVHCNHGRDRTGLIIAIYRLANEGWTAEEAQREANHHGMFWWKFGLKNYIRDYYSRLRRKGMSPTALAAPTRQSVLMPAVYVTVPKPCRVVSRVRPVDIPFVVSLTLTDREDPS